MDEGSDLTPAEQQWLRSRLQLLRDRDSWIMGTFAEHVVAVALTGSFLGTSSISEWDLTWHGIKVEVKCSTQRQAGATEGSRPSAELWRVPTHYAWNHEVDDWHPGDKKRWADVYVLARHEGFDHKQGWSFYVVPRWWLDERESGTVGGPALRAAGWGPHTPDELPPIVLDAHRSQSGHQDSDGSEM